MIARVAVLAMAVLGLAAGPADANQVDYFCIFATQLTAQADGPVGAFWNASAASWDQSRTFPDVKVVTAQAIVNGISSLTGFWIVVSSIGSSAALDADTNCVMKLDRDAANDSKSFVLSAGIVGTSRTGMTFAPVPHGAKYPRPLGQ